MSTIHVTLEPHPDGTVHLPLPVELRGGRVTVTAMVEPAQHQSEAYEVHRQRDLLSLLDELRARNPFQGIQDPIAWQREVREDRPLPFTE